MAGYSREDIETIIKDNRNPEDCALRCRMCEISSDKPSGSMGLSDRERYVLANNCGANLDGRFGGKTCIEYRRKHNC